MADEPATISKYRVLGKLASGGMGDVWLARAQGPARFEKVVVLKTIRPHEHATTEQMTQMFLREARVAGLLGHPNCVQVFDFGEDHGTYFIAMEFLDGMSLARIVKRAEQLGLKLPLGFVARVLADAASGLDYAHTLKDASGTRLELIHRDVSPDNLLVTFAGHTKVLDFGIAKATAAIAGERTQSGQLKGKYGYMAPEYLRGGPIDARVDVFALGVVAYRALTGERPFEGESDAQVMAAILEKAPKPLRERRADVPAAFEAVVAKALEKDPGERYGSAKELRAAILASMPDLPDHDAVAEYLATLWPENDPDRVKLRELAAVVSDTPTTVDAPRAATIGDAPTTVHVARRGRRVAIALAAAAAVGIAATAFVLANRPHAEPPAKAAAPPPYGATKPVSVLLADFDNHTGDQVFDGTLEPAFTVALEGASFVNAYNRGTARKLALKLKPDSTGLDPTIARLVAAREGVAVVITGAIDKVGGGYKLSVAALDSANGGVIYHGDVTGARKSDLLPAVAGLAAHIRNALGDATPESVQIAAAETVTTSSLDAAHEYALAQREWLWNGKADAATAHFLKAAELDPEMGRAYSGLAVLAYNAGRLQDADKYFALAMSKIDRMSERERYRTRGVYYLSVGNLDKAIEELSELVKQYPYDNAGVANLAAAYSWHRDWPHALEIGKRAVEINPKSVPHLGNYGLFLLQAGKFEDAIVQLDATLAENPSYEVAHVGHALADLALGHEEAAIERWKKLATLGGDGASRAAAGLADIALYDGRYADAIATLEPAIAADLEAKNPDVAALKSTMLAHAYTLAARPKDARAALERGLAASQEPNVVFWAAQDYIELGDEAKASPLIANLANRIGAEQRADAEVLRAELELAHHHAQAAIDHARAAQQILDIWIARYVLARAYLEKGAFTEAQSEAETCLKRVGEATELFLDEQPTFALVPPVHYYLGRALEGLHSREAADAYRQFIAIKSHGDDPLLADARRRVR